MVSDPMGMFTGVFTGVKTGNSRYCFLSTPAVTREVVTTDDADRTGALFHPLLQSGR